MATTHTYTVIICAEDEQYDADAAMTEAMEFLSESAPGDMDLSILADRPGAVVTDHTYIAP